MTVIDGATDRTDRTDRLTQLSPIKRALFELEEMSAKLHALEAERTEPIAIVGMGCRFPGGVNGPEAYWQLLQAGVDAVTEIPQERWNLNAYYDADPTAPGKMSTITSAWTSHSTRSRLTKRYSSSSGSAGS